MKIPRADGRMVLAGVLVLGTVGAVVLVLALLWQALDRQAQDYQTLRSDYQSLYSDAIQAGAKPDAPAPSDVPVVDPIAPLAPAATPAPGPSGPAGPGPTREQVRAAVQEMFDTGEFDGEDGRPPTDAELDAAVERYCAEDTCDGEDGSDGAKGDVGDTGPQGPGPTPDQIRIALEAYCAAQPGGSCEGATGERGEKGDAGADSTVPGPKGDIGPQGTALPGDYNCPEGQFMAGFSVATDGAVTLNCVDLLTP